jgi:nucleoside-diphosphate-sugar epimerase
VVALVTGADRFLGAHIAHGLAAAGRRIVGAGRPEIEIPSARFGELLSETRPEAVVHCAGPASVGASVQDPLADLEGSVAVLAAVLDGARRLDPPRGAHRSRRTSCPGAEP